MRQFLLAVVLLASTAALASAARSSARFSAAAAPVAPVEAKTKQAEPEYKYGDYKRSDSYEYDSEEEKAYYSKEPHVINLELLCPDNNNGAATPSATANTTNLQLGLVCSHKSEYYDTKYEAYGDEDEQPLIKGTPTALEEIGRGSATIRWLNTQRTVEIEHQRALEVATLSGEFDEFEDAASCDPLLTRKARITFTDVPVYAMVTRVTLPLDSSMLERLLPLSDPGASPPPGSPNIPNIPGLLPGGLLPNLPSLPSGRDSASIQQATEGNGIVNTGTNTVARAPGQGARVAVASAATPADYAYYQDETLCGLTLVAKGPARLRIQGSDRTYAGSMESTLLWTNGLVSLPSFMADAIGASGGRSTQSLFSTTINQVLSSTVYNGWSDAQLNVLVGNSVSSTAIGPGSRAPGQGGTVNITVADNSAIANSDNATVTAGNTLSGNRVNVFNSMGSAMEQYLKLLKTMCKHHKDIPESKPGRVRFDLTPLRAAETAETSGRSGRTA